MQVTTLEDKTIDRVLVTGGAGFIGSHVVDCLLVLGKEIIVLDNLSSGNPSYLPQGVPLIQFDISDPAVVERIAVTRPDAIVHCAAQVSVPRSMLDPARDRAVNLVGMEHVIVGAQHAGGCRVVFLSTGGGIYGEVEQPATETNLPCPKAYYSVHKYTAERYLEMSGLPYAIARLSNVYGPRQRRDLEGGVVAILARNLAAHEPIVIYGDGEQRRDFLYVSDAADAIVTMLTAGVDGLWNVGTGRATSINDLLAAAEKIFGPATSVLHEQARVADICSSVLSAEKIAVELGWRVQRSLEDGLCILKEHLA